MPLNLRQERFCREYVKTGIAGEAYRRAGYRSTGEAIYFNASRLKAMDKVKSRIEELTDQAIDAADLTKDKLLGRAVEIMNRAKEQGNVGAEGQMLERLLKVTGAWVEKREDVTKASDTAILEQLKNTLEPLVGKEMAEAAMRQAEGKLRPERPSQPRTETDSTGQTIN